jgi:ABC-type cobalamin/Fe3+-siderophores transport system ATPase subunit
LALQASEQVWLLRESQPFHAGTPGEVIQEGLIQDTFCPPGVTFDGEARRFNVSWP